MGDHVWEIGRLAPMRRISIHGSMHGHKAVVALLVGHHPMHPLHNVALCVTLHPHEHRIAFSASKDGHWSGESSVEAHRLHAHEPFTLEIVCKHEHFDVHLNGESIKVYEHHHHGVHLEHITHVLFDGDINVSQRHLL